MEIQNYENLISFPLTQSEKKARQLALDLFKFAVDSIDSYKIITKKIVVNKNKNFLTCFGDKFSIHSGKVWIIGAGKAVGRMVEALEEVFTGYDLEGLVCVPIGVKSKLKTSKISVYESTHPFPSDDNINNTKKVIKLIDQINKNDLVIGLISGGGSAIWSAPIPPLTLDDLITLNKLLINSGMTIDQINVIRKHVSRIKGGKLANLIKATTIVLVQSDVVGDSLESIASGPFFPDRSTNMDAKDILGKFNLWNSIPSSVKIVLNSGIADEEFNLVKRNSPVNHYILSTNMLAQKIIVSHAKKLGFNASLQSEYISGDARTLGKRFARKMYSKMLKEQKFQIIVSGGETTVKVTGKGVGGRNQEFIGGFLEIFLEKNDHSDVLCLSVGTDGIDGNSPYAGAIIDRNTLKRIRNEKLNLNRYQWDNNLTKFFEEVGSSLILTGPTGNNIMDLQITFLSPSKIESRID